MKRTVLERLRAKSESDPATGCRNWTGSCNEDGYGRIMVDGRILKPHRLAYELACGKLPPGVHVCHRCDNPRCINPAHLFRGTAADNMADKKKKGRQARGETNGQAKLNETDVLAIRSENGLSQRELAAKYGISKTQVGRILSRETWVWIT